MRPKSKREQFYQEVAEAMVMNTTRSFINLQTLQVEVMFEEMYGLEEKKQREREFEDEDKYLPINVITPSESFRVMEAFTETVKNRNLQTRLIQALEKKKPFVNFKTVVDNSPVRQAWFDFRDSQYSAKAKEWVEDNAPDELKEKIKQLPAVFVA